MHIFISWSGNRSKAVAEALREWLPNVIQAVRPWMSGSDIEKGQRWSFDVAEQLAKSKVGIICLTPENLAAPWILFEAGALSKTLDMTYVCPYLHELDPKEIEGPLSQFQATKGADKEDMRKLIQTINRALGDLALTESRLDEIFDRWWPDLKRKLKKVPPLDLATARPKQDSEMLREMYEAFKTMARTNL